MAIKNISRVLKRKPLSDFFGVLSEESGERFEKAVYTLRKKRNKKLLKY